MARSGALAAMLLVAACAAQPPRSEKQSWEPTERSASESPFLARLTPEARRLLAMHDQRCQRYVSSCVELGRLWETGKSGFPRDPQMAAEAYALACRRLDPIGCSQLEQLLGAEDTMPRDARAVRETFDAACRQRLAEGCVGLATMEAFGLDGPPSATRAVARLKWACDEGHGGACERLGRLVRAGLGATQDAEEADRLEAKACSLGLDLACVAVGMRSVQHTGGKDTDWNKRNAVERGLTLISKACARSEYAGCVAFAEIQLAGEAVPKDVHAAEKLLRTACNDGSGRACVLLGSLASTGGEAGAGPGERLKWWKLGCTLRSAESCERTAEAIEPVAAEAGGRAPGPELSQALPLYERACVLHAPTACATLARLHRQGLGVPPDPRKADAYGALACRLGAPAAGCVANEAARILRPR